MIGSPDFAPVRGQETVRRVSEIAAAGHHHLLLVGPEGAGKRMLLRRLPSILPILSDAEQSKLQVIYRSTSLGRKSSIPVVGPQDDPRTAVGTAGKLHAVFLAEFGLLLLPELQALPRPALESLSQFLDEGESLLRGAEAGTIAPVRFLLGASIWSCPCGRSLGSCTCGAHAKARHLSRIPPALLECFHLRTGVLPVRLTDLAGPEGESSQEIWRRVEDSRRRQYERLGRGQMNGLQHRSTKALTSFIPDEAARKIFTTAADRQGLSSLQAITAALVARTIADLSASETVHDEHLAEAIQYVRGKSSPLEEQEA